MTATPRRVIPWRRSAIAVVVLAASLVTAGGIAFHDGRTYSSVDWHIATWIYFHISHRFVRELVHITSPTGVTALIALVVIVAMFARNLRLASTAALGPLVAFMLTEWILKPVVARRLMIVPGWPLVPGNSYPSGHETGLASLTVVLALVVAAITTSVAWRVAAVLTALVVDLLGSLALVGNFYHYATDTFAAIGVSLVAILGVGLLVDTYAESRVSSPDAETLASTARAA